MSESAPETPAPAQAPAPVPTPAEAVAAGQIAAQAPAAAASQQGSAPAANAAEQEPTDWESEAVKWKALARQHEKKNLGALGFKSKDEISQLRQAAEAYQQQQDAQKTEIQRATERTSTVEQQLADLRSTNARLMAAAAHSIPPDLIDLLGSGTDEEIEARAAVLAERLKATAPAAAAAPAPAVRQRPVESLTPGAAPASSGTAANDADAWIRALTGR